MIKKGDYLIHILIHQARNLNVRDEETVDPIVQVQCLGKHKYSTCKDDVGCNATIQWSEHLFFEPKDLTQQDIQDGKIKIKVLDQQMFKNAVIGVYELDLSFIYFKDKHAIFNQWVGLSNPGSKSFNELSGYLKISASVIGPGDEQVPLNDGPNIDRTDKEVMLLPPHISMQYYQLKFRLIKAEKLPKMDSFGTCDAFVKVKYLGKSIKTSVVTQKNDQVYWAQEIWLPVQFPIVSSRVVMQVYDYDTASDDIVGSISFDVVDIIKKARSGENNTWFWKDIYGAPMGVSGEHTDEMNRVPEIASQWKGRILMQVAADRTEKPEMKIKHVEEEVMQEAANSGLFK